MIYQGRQLDPISLWSRWIDFPDNMQTDTEFSDLVVCPNPNHNTFKRHFQVNLRKPLVHCFAGCGISGTYEHAIAIIEGLDNERAARKIVLRGSRVSLERADSEKNNGSRNDVRSTDEVDADIERCRKGGFHWLPQKARTYLDSRGIDAPARGKWQIGWDEDTERIVIPAFDEKGTLRFLIRRGLSPLQRPKYLYSKGFPKSGILYGACNLDRDQVRSTGLILVEGSFDCVRLHQMGFRNAVAILGTGISLKQRSIIDRIGPKRIYLAFDKDVAGVANILTAHERFPKIPLLVCRYPAHRDDPAEMTTKEVQNALSRALPISIFFQKSGMSPKRRKVGKANLSTAG